MAAAVTRRRRRPWLALVGVLLLVLLAVELLVWVQTRPSAPAGAAPVAATAGLAARHGCRVPELWGVDPAAGALVGSADRVAWVPIAQVRRFQPAWQVRQWCAR